MHMRSLEQALIANAYLEALQHEESLQDFQPVPAGQVKLTPGGRLVAGDHPFELVAEARTDLAKLAPRPLAIRSCAVRTIDRDQIIDAEAAMAPPQGLV